MRYSYWDKTVMNRKADFAIVGAGFSGLYIAENLSEKYPDAHIVLLDRHMLTRTASTRNGGFACFGSLTEIESDLKQMTSSACVDLVQRRYDGLQTIKKSYVPERIDWEPYGGYELISTSDCSKEDLLNRIADVNKLLDSIHTDDVFSLDEDAPNLFGLNKGYYVVKNGLEAGLNPAKMVAALRLRLLEKGVDIAEQNEVKNIQEINDGYELELDVGKIQTHQLIFANNAMVGKYLPSCQAIRPTRNMVMVSKSIPNLALKGLFHMLEGYIYFRSIGNERILIGGGRHWDMENEFTEEYGWNPLLEEKLSSLMADLLPDNRIEWEHQWSGIMGVGESKDPVVEKINDRLYVCAGFGGMGVALTASSANFLVNQLITL